MNATEGAGMTAPTLTVTISVQYHRDGVPLGGATTTMKASRREHPDDVPPIDATDTLARLRTAFEDAVLLATTSALVALALPAEATPVPVEGAPA